MKLRFNLILLIVVIVSHSFSMDSKKFQTQTTTAFKLKYEKGITSKEVKKIGEMLENAYAEYQKLFNLSLNSKVEVVMFTSVNRFQNESQTRAFADGDYRGGKLFIALPAKPQRTEGMQNVANRIIARALLEKIPSCPGWLAEAYALYAGGDLQRFGDPAQVNVSSFSDLSEDFVRAEEKRDAVELYAKLSVTIGFLVDRYGKERVEEALLKFKNGGGIQDVFPSVFNEKLTVIEKEWVKALRTHVRP